MAAGICGPRIRLSVPRPLSASAPDLPRGPFTTLAAAARRMHDVRWASPRRGGSSGIVSGRSGPPSTRVIVSVGHKAADFTVPSPPPTAPSISAPFGREDAGERRRQPLRGGGCRPVRGLAGWKLDRGGGRGGDRTALISLFADEAERHLEELRRAGIQVDAKTYALDPALGAAAPRRSRATTAVRDAGRNPRSPRSNTARSEYGTETRTSAPNR